MTGLEMEEDGVDPLVALLGIEEITATVPVQRPVGERTPTSRQPIAATIFAMVPISMSNLEQYLEDKGDPFALDLFNAMAINAATILEWSPHTHPPHNCHTYRLKAILHGA